MTYVEDLVVLVATSPLIGRRWILKLALLVDIEDHLGNVLS
jgi:hypothetical protein